MRSWAIAPDFANLIVSYIYECKPKIILEAGSGISTLIAAYCLKEVGEGSIVSLDNTEKFAVNTADNVIKHGLQSIASVVHAPIEEVVIGEETWLWYETRQIKHLTSIDMLIVDGPPSHIQKMARYPALPLLFNVLSENAVVILDDCKRDDERKIVDRWLREFHDFQCEWVDTEKGAAILRKTGNDRH
jgi:predicted O-methyltransferase YrrM